MPRPRPPSRIDVVKTPLFGLCWYGDPGDGTSIIAHCGGGGSAATGVQNLLTIQKFVAGQEQEEDGEVVELSTGDQVGVALTIVRNPQENVQKLYVALGKEVHCYTMDGTLVDKVVSIGENVNAIAVNSMVDRLAVGCESGVVQVFKIDPQHPNVKVQSVPEFRLEGHEKAVCSVAFSPRGDKLVSSAKDGTARVWNSHDGESLGVLTCSIQDPKAPPPKRTPQVLVRGCAFGDLLGQVVYTVASGRRGKAFLSKWILVVQNKDDDNTNNQQQYDLLTRTECSPCPVSAMSLSGDAGLVALGAVDGTIILWGMERWKPLKKFHEVHDLPVTCIAARPYPVPLKGDLDGIPMHALSASADSQMACLSLQKKTRNRRSSRSSLKRTLHSLLRMALFAWILYPVANEVWDKCQEEWHDNGYAKAWECIRQDVLIAPVSRPGILVPPH